jgi:hypothetical protein
LVFVVLDLVFVVLGLDFVVPDLVFVVLDLEIIVRHGPRRCVPYLAARMVSTRAHNALGWART